MLIGVLACYALLFVLFVAYSLSSGGPSNLIGIQEIVGLLVLAAAGTGVGLLGEPAQLAVVVKPDNCPEA